MKKSIIIIVLAILLIGVPTYAVTVLSVKQGGTGVGSFTSGQVLYGNGTGDLQDADSLFYDSGNDRVGIGVTDPATILEVSADGSAITLTDSGDSGNERVKLGDSDTNGGFIDITDDSEAVTARIRSYASSGVQAFFIAGDIGIGVTAPKTHLDVASYQADGITIGADNDDNKTRTNVTTKTGGLHGVHYTNAEESIGIFSYTSTNTASSLNLGGGNSDWNAVTDIKFLTAADTTTTAGTERMRINSSGLIGMGNTNPARNLEISESAGNADIQLSTWSTTDTQKPNIVFLKSNSATINTLAATAAGEDLGSVLAQGVHTGNAIASSSQILFEGDAAPNGSAVPGRISFWTSDTTSNQERMRIDDAGQVGIGTTAPAEELHVVGDIRTDGGSQNYTIGHSGNNLGFSGLSAATPAAFDLYSGDGDGTDPVFFNMYAVGTLGSITDRERLRVGYDNAGTEFWIQSEANGTGTLRPIEIYTEGNADQILLATDGSVSMSGAADVVGAFTAGSVASDAAVTGTTMTASAASSLTLGAGSAADGAIIYNNATNANTLTVQSGATSGSYTLTLPLAVAGAGEVLTDAAGNGVLSWSAVGGGDVTSVGDCNDGACYDGSADGGTYVRLYDGDSHYSSIASANVAANTAFVLPATAGTLYGTGTGSISSANLLGSLSDETGTGVSVFGTAPTFTTNLTVTNGGVLDADGMDVVSGNDYQINNTSVLNATTLGGAVVSSSLTSVGALASGSLAAGFTDVPVAQGGTGASTLTDGGVLLGSGTSAITPMAVLADGSIIVGDGATDPVALAAFTSSTGDVKHEAGGLEFDASGVADGDLIVGTGAGTMALRVGALSAGAAGFVKHELGGLEFDASAVAIGDIPTGSGAGTMALVTSTGHSDGDVFTRQADGSADWEAAAGGGAWTLMSYSTASGTLGITISSLDLAADEYYRVMVMADDTVVKDYEMKFGTETAGYAWGGDGDSFSGSAWTIGTARSSTSDADCQLAGFATNVKSMNGTVDLFVQDLFDGSNAQVVAEYNIMGTGITASNDGYEVIDGACMTTNIENNLTSLVFEGSSGTQDWKVWVLKANKT